MTTPGYPDWERVVRAGGDPITSVNQNITAQLNLGPFNVQQWASVIMFALSGVGGDFYQINWLWFADKAGTQLLSSIFQVLGPDMQFPLTVPVAGPWLEIQIIPKAGGKNVPVVFTLYGAASQYDSWEVNTYSSGLIQDASAYPVNGVTTFTAANEFYGAVLLHVSPFTTTMTGFTLQTYNFASGAYVPLIKQNNMSNVSPFINRVMLPAAPYQLIIGNGATAQNILALMMPMP